MFQSRKVNSFACAAAGVATLVNSGCAPERVADLSDLHTVQAQEDYGFARVSAVTNVTDITLTSGDASVGSVQQYWVAARESFALYDAHGELQATAIKRALFSIGECIDIYDQDDNLIGHVREDVWKSATNLLAPHKRFFKITDKDDKLIAESEKYEVIGTTITLTDPQGQTLAILSRSGLDVGKATWKLDKTGEIDWRLMIFIPSFKTSADSRQKQARE